MVQILNIHSSYVGALVTAKQVHSSSRFEPSYDLFWLAGVLGEDCQMAPDI